MYAETSETSISDTEDTSGSKEEDNKSSAYGSKCEENEMIKKKESGENKSGDEMKMLRVVG